MINEGVKKYCNEDISLIENFEKAIIDSNQMWHCHHRREMTTSRKELIELGEYYNRPSSELIFLTEHEHRALHNTLIFKGKPSHWLGKHMSDETKQKVSIALKGKTAWNKGKKLSKEHKQKMADTMKSLHWFNNGIKNVFVKECPEGFVRGMLKRKAI